MVVAAGAADRQPQEDKPGRLGDVVQSILPAKLLIVQVDHVGVAAVESRGDERPGIVGLNFVTGKLKPDETVVRQVAVQGIDDPIAISPRIRPSLVELKTVGFGKPRQVEPVLPRALPILGACKQAVDQPLVGIRRPVGEKRLLQFEARWQSDQVEAEPPQERRTIGFARVLLLLRFQSRKDEAVDRIAHPGQFAHARHRRAHRRNERPVLVVVRTRRWCGQKHEGAAQWNQSVLSFHGYSSKDRSNHGAGSIGEAVVAAVVREGEPGVVEAE